jgi:hypothetical protein
MTDPVTATVQIDAGPDVVYGLITDPPTLASLAEEAVANIELTLQRLKQRAEAG